MSEQRPSGPAPWEPKGGTMLPVLTYPPKDMYPLPIGDYVAIHEGYAVRVSYGTALSLQASGAPYAHWSMLEDEQRDTVWESRERIIGGRY